MTTKENHTTKPLSLFGAEMSWGVHADGLKDSLHVFQNLYPDFHFSILDFSDIEEDEVQIPNLKNLKAVTEANRRICSYASAALAKGQTPLFIGGDHSSAIGTVAASSQVFPGEGLIWIDAHPDLHLPETSWSGNIHGMPVAVSLGKGEKGLVALANGAVIRPEHVLYLGLRDIDFAEQEHLDQWGIRYYTYDVIMERGLEEVLSEGLAYLESVGVNGVHVSLDMDSMDPLLLPGVSVPVGGGFSVPEVDQILAAIRERFQVNAMDIVEYNPKLDKSGVSGMWLARMLHEIREL